MTGLVSSMLSAFLQITLHENLFATSVDIFCENGKWIDQYI